MPHGKVITAFLLLMATRCAVAQEDFFAIQRRLGIPLTIATVVQASGTEPRYILIQDIHRHPEAQENIRALILHGLREWGAKEIFLEGAWSAGENQDYAFFGLEDEPLYRENVAAYEAVDRVRQDALRQLQTARLIARATDSNAQPWAGIKQLIELRLKPAEYAEYVKHPYRPAFESALSQAVSAAEHFYEVANERSHVFLERSRSLHQSGPQVLVAGGFHTAQMVDELRREGTSFVVLSPRITQGGYDDLYTLGMQETISALKLK